MNEPGPGGVVEAELPAALPAALSARQRLQQEPTRFSLDQAVAVLAPGADPVNLAYQTVASLSAPAGEVAIEGKGDELHLQTPTFGLIGPGGVLPRHYTAWVESERRRRSPALQALVDLLSRRFTGLYVKAGAKYRPTRNPRHAQEVLAAAVGLGTPHLSSALVTPLAAVLHHAGGLSLRTRSVERLRGLLSEETGFEVQVIEFAGGWTRLPATEQTRLSAMGGHGRLGLDASIGNQVWDPASRFIVKLGPMPLATFRRMLPGTAFFRRLVELTRLQSGLEQDFAFNPVLAADAVPPLRLGLQADGSGAQLGWTSWLNAPRARQHSAGETLLHPHGLP